MCERSRAADRAPRQGDPAGADAWFLYELDGERWWRPVNFKYGELDRRINLAGDRSLYGLGYLGGRSASAEEVLAEVEVDPGCLLGPGYGVVFIRCGDLPVSWVGAIDACYLKAGDDWLFAHRQNTVQVDVDHAVAAWQARRIHRDPWHALFSNYEFITPKQIRLLDQKRNEKRAGLELTERLRAAVPAGAATPVPRAGKRGSSVAVARGRKSLRKAQRLQLCRRGESEPVAIAKTSRDGNVLLTRGSKLRRRVSPDAGRRVREQVEGLAERGVLSVVDEEWWQLERDLPVSSVSAAGTLVLGRRVGAKEWRTDAGKRIAA